MRMKPLILLAFGLVFLASCDDEMPRSEEIAIENPTTYEFLRNNESTVSFSGQTARINMGTELIGAMMDFDKTTESLLEMYANQTASGADANPYADASLNESTKSVKSKVAASSDFFSINSAESARIKSDIESWIVAQVEEVFPNKDVLAESGRAGQIADGSSVRYVSAKGLEYNQAVNKSLIGALMVDQIVNNYLSISVLDAGDNMANNDADIVAEGKSYTTMEHKWDEAYGYLFGLARDESNPLATLGEDSFLNKYLSRVNDDSDFENIASDIFEAFKLGRAAIVAKDYQVRDQQAEIIRDRLAQVIAVRAIYYLQSGKNAIASDDLGGAFHDLSEGFGFVYSLRFLRQANSSNPYFTREDVDGFVNKLTEGNGFWDIDAATLDSMSDIIADKFDFTVAQAAG